MTEVYAGHRADPTVENTELTRRCGGTETHREGSWSPAPRFSATPCETPSAPSPPGLEEQLEPELEFPLSTPAVGHVVSLVERDRRRRPHQCHRVNGRAPRMHVVARHEQRTVTAAAIEVEVARRRDAIRLATVDQEDDAYLVTEFAWTAGLSVNRKETPRRSQRVSLAVSDTTGRKRRTPVA